MSIWITVSQHLPSIDHTPEVHIPNYWKTEETDWMRKSEAVTYLLKIETFLKSGAYSSESLETTGACINSSLAYKSCLLGGKDQMCLYQRKKSQQMMLIISSSFYIRSSGNIKTKIYLQWCWWSRRGWRNL